VSATRAAGRQYRIVPVDLAAANRLTIASSGSPDHLILAA
jgi:hypothetical protein